MIPPMEKLVDMTMMMESLNPTKVQHKNSPYKSRGVILYIGVPIEGF